MTRLRTEVRSRLLGNDWFTRPAELDCSFESTAESCTHFATNTTFRAVLAGRREHAARNTQIGRAELSTTLMDRIERVEQ